MKSLLVTITALTFFTLISCNQAKQGSEKEGQATVPPTNQEQNTTKKSDSTETIEVKTTQQSSDEQDNAEVMLNPPHGEPHHRCDIPVGAPLNSEPVNTTRQTTNSPTPTTAPDLSNNPTAPTVENAKRLNSSQTQSTSASSSGEKPRLNPPHGQPWHRCDIAVGSPLP